CPGDRPDRYRKAAVSADTVIIDLEDAVSAANKDAARRALIAEPLDPARVVLRVNTADSVNHAADIEALRQTDYRTVMLAKTDYPGQLERLAKWTVIALVETPVGVQ